MADKSKTIKGATDKELDELIIRLRKEYELQNLVADLQRRSTPENPYSYNRPSVSTEESIESMYHVGVLGMRWGTRRRGGGSGTKRVKKSGSVTDISDEHKKKVMLKKKKLSQMSNSELKTLNERMQLERQYKDLTKSETSAGRKFVTDVLTSVAKQTATAYVSKYMALGAAAAIKKAVG